MDPKDLPACPKCGDEMEHRKHRYNPDRMPNAPDADWFECPTCGYQTDPE